MATRISDTRLDPAELRSALTDARRRASGAAASATDLVGAVAERASTAARKAVPSEITDRHDANVEQPPRTTALEAAGRIDNILTLLESQIAPTMGRLAQHLPEPLTDMADGVIKQVESAVLQLQELRTQSRKQVERLLGTEASAVPTGARAARMAPVRPNRSPTAASADPVKKAAAKKTAPKKAAPAAKAAAKAASAEAPAVKRTAKKAAATKAPAGRAAR